VPSTNEACLKPVHTLYGILLGIHNVPYLVDLNLLCSHAMTCDIHLASLLLLLPSGLHLVLPSAGHTLLLCSLLAVRRPCAQLRRSIACVWPP
jgi:hypothetical protein